MNQLHTNSSVIPNSTTIHLTDRQLKYLALRAEGKTRLESAKLAGYGNDPNPSKIEQSENLRKALLLSMESRGLTSDKIAEKIVKGIESKKIFFSSFKGQIVSERIVDDNETQHKYVKTALEIRGDLVQDNTNNMQIGLIVMPQASKDVDQWNTGT